MTATSSSVLNNNQYIDILKGYGPGPDKKMHFEGTNRAENWRQAWREPQGCRQFHRRGGHLADPRQIHLP